MGTTIRPKKKTPKSRIKWGLSLARGSLSPSPHLLLSFMLLFSSLCCCSPFRAIAVFALFFFSPYYSPHRVVALLFTLLLFLFTLLGFPFHAIVLLQLFFYFRYEVFRATILFFTLLCFPLCAVVVGVLLFIEDSCITPLHFFLQELGMVGSQ
jgi:hypothetical protein